MLRIIFFCILFLAYILQSKDFPLKSLTEGKKTIYHWKKRKMRDALYFTRCKIQKVAAYNFFLYTFSCIYSAIERFSSEIFKQRKENYLSSKRKKRKMENALYFTRCKIQKVAAYNFFLVYFFLHIFCNRKIFLWDL